MADEQQQTTVPATPPAPAAPAPAAKVKAKAGAPAAKVNDAPMPQGLGGPSVHTNGGFGGGDQ